MQRRIALFEAIALAGIIISLLAGLLVRVSVTAKILDEYTDCAGCYRSMVVQYDAWLFVLILTLLVVSYWVKWRFITFACRLLVLVFLTLYWLDIYTLSALNHRLVLEDIGAYANIETLSSFFSQPLDWWILPSGLLLAFMSLLWLFLCWLKVDSLLFSKRFSIALLLSSGLLFVPYLKTKDYLLPEYVHNYLFHWFLFGEQRGYSQDFINEVEPHISDYEATTCYSDGLNQKKNIILVIVESLSSYQSQLFSGLNDWTPHLDQMARDNVYYSNFLSNSFASTFSRISLLTGEVPIYPYPLTITDYRNTTSSVPRLLAKSGYHSAILLGGDLGFLGTGRMMQALDFDYVEGQEYQGYAGQPRFSFASVSDEVLYQRSLNYINERNSPYFLTVVTVSSHAPYIHPETNERSIEKTIRYADKALLGFYQQLKEAGFFDNGLLLITSDHRAMVPIDADEKNALGIFAKSKVPLVLIDGQQQGENTRYLQQADLLPSLAYLTQQRYCLRAHENNLFQRIDDEARHRCVYHVNGQSRNTVEVFCQNNQTQGIIQLAGDDTGYETGNLSNPQWHVDWVNRNRVNAILRGREYLRIYGKD